MAKYRKKPVFVEAMQFTDRTKDQVLTWVRCNTAVGFNEKGEPILKIQTLKGVMTANPGDYVIKGVQGEFYPCREDIFHKTYDSVSEGEGT